MAKSSSKSGSGTKDNASSSKTNFDKIAKLKAELAALQAKVDKLG
jgi:hypothetical protein